MYISDYREAPVRKAVRLSSKRMMDITLSSALLIILSPLMLIIALLVSATSRGPVIYRHKRVGLGGREFEVFKFRSMVNGAENRRRLFTPEQEAEFLTMYKLRKDPRVTPFGGLLRRTSLDELPQLINVLIGDMSIVGPRPVTREELDKYGSNAGLLLSVNPGITGLWQISGRNDISYEDRVRLDIRYARDNCLAMDLRIMLSTVRVIASRIGAY